MMSLTNILKGCKPNHDLCPFGIPTSAWRRLDTGDYIVLGFYDCIIAAVSTWIVRGPRTIVSQRNAFRALVLVGGNIKYAMECLVEDFCKPTVPVE
jgi:hypothetical protein